MNHPVDIRIPVLKVSLSPRFTKHDAFLLVAGALGAVIFGLVIAYIQGSPLL